MSINVGHLLPDVNRGTTKLASGTRRVGSGKEIHRIDGYLPSVPDAGARGVVLAALAVERLERPLNATDVQTEPLVFFEDAATGR